MNARKTSISNLMNDTSTSSGPPASTGFNLTNILNEEPPPTQHYHHHSNSNSNPQQLPPPTNELYYNSTSRATPLQQHHYQHATPSNQTSHHHQHNLSSQTELQPQQPPPPSQPHMSDVEITHPPDLKIHQKSSRAKNTPMSISALIDPSTESAHNTNNTNNNLPPMEISPSISQQRYHPHDQYQHLPMQEEINPHVGNAIDINGANNISINTTTPKIPPKEPKGVAKRPSHSPQKRRPSDANDFGAQKTKIPRTSHSQNHYHSGAPPSSAVGGHKMNDLVEHLGEDRKYVEHQHLGEDRKYYPVTGVPPSSHQPAMDWERNRSQSHLQQSQPPPIYQNRLSDNGGQSSISKDSSTSYPQTKSTTFSQCGPNDHRALKFESPQHAVNGFSHVSQVGAMEMTPPLPPQSIHHTPTPNGQISVSSQFPDKYRSMVRITSSCDGYPIEFAPPSLE
ncbi:2129_t:CDS:10 [Ambispora leptoticha]|uniref:2129_t:CDS:1 n=1 Tax=Ambispora leptoticha TaxID=144679 RepID=A0A9N8VUS6_9GLOM|nr:2129_t:CDS:10 [Ambispora leptoticha]